MQPRRGVLLDHERVAVRWTSPRRRTARACSRSPLPPIFAEVRSLSTRPGGSRHAFRIRARHVPESPARGALASPLLNHGEEVPVSARSGRVVSRKGPRPAPGTEGLNPLDEDRAASLADEGGVSAATKETQDRDRSEGASMLFELTILPLGEVHMSDEIAEVLEVIERSGLPYKLAPGSTYIEGTWDEVLPVVSRVPRVRARGLAPRHHVAPHRGRRGSAQQDPDERGVGRGQGRTQARASFVDSACRQPPSVPLEVLDRALVAPSRGQAGKRPEVPAAPRARVFFRE